MGARKKRRLSSSRTYPACERLFVESLSQFAQEQLSVGDQSRRLEATPIGELSDHRRIDIDHDRAHGSGQEIAGSDRVQHRGHHHRHLDAWQGRAHLLLRLLHIANHARHRAIVADRTGQDHAHAMRKRLIRNALFEQAGRNRLLNRTDRANSIDGAQVITVSALDLLAAAQIDAQRRAEKRRFDIMGNNGIAAENDLNVPLTDKLSDVAACARVDDRRAEHKENTAAPGPRLFHLARNLMDGQHLDLLSRDAALHKGEGLALPGAFKGLHANPAVSDNHALTYLHFVHWLAIRAPLCYIDNDRHIHLNALHRHPLALDADLGWQVRGGVETGGQDACLLYQGSLRVVPIDQGRAKLLKLGKNQLQRLIVRGLHF